MEILHRDDLHYGGFAGLREHRLVVNRQFLGFGDNDVWDGLGNFVYLADAKFNPKGDTGMHPHREVDVISVMIEGRVAHEGSMGHGGMVNQYQVQVQRAGGEGFLHNEVNPDEVKNRMLQLWVLPEVAGEPAAYKIHSPKWGETTQIYGGTDTFPANTAISVAMLKGGDTVDIAADGLTYMAKGQGTLDGTELKDGDLFRGQSGEFKAEDDAILILVSAN